jgi:hypothetical protein
MRKKISVTKLCGFLDERFYKPVEPTELSELSQERIRELAFAKLRTQDGANNQHKEKHMKKSVKILLVAAVVCAMSVTAFAAMGGMDFFRAIFGDSAGVAADHIQFPEASVENEGYRLSVESLLSDGFKSDLIISLTSKDGKRIETDPMDMFHTEFWNNPDAMNSESYEEMVDFSQKDKKYYHMAIISLNSHYSTEVTISLKEEIAPLSVTVPLNDAMTARKEIRVSADDYAEQNYYPETVQLSPLGVLVIGSEKEAKGGLPTAQIFVQMKDGTREELISRMSFDEGDGETVGGGGGAIILGPGETAPLVIGTMGERNPDGKVVTSGTFSRVLNLDEVQAILVDDVEYPLS